MEPARIQLRVPHDTDTENQSGKDDWQQQSSRQEHQADDARSRIDQQHDDPRNRPQEDEDDE